MFKNCCARPNKKISKTKSISENIDNLSASKSSEKEQKELANMNETSKSTTADCIESSGKTAENPVDHNLELNNSSKFNDSVNYVQKNISFDETVSREAHAMKDLGKKRLSIDYHKKGRLDFKRFSVDFRHDSATLEELAQLEQELARTNVDVRLPARRKSTGILKSTTSSNNDVGDHKSLEVPKSYNDEEEDDEVFEKRDPEVVGEVDGPKDPPATPIGRDELALRRHRFFSELVCAARAAVEHRVRFDPLGPVIADSGSDIEQIVLAANPAAEFEALIERLERVTSRLERLPVLRERTPPRSPAPNPAVSVTPPLEGEPVEPDSESIEPESEPAELESEPAELESEPVDLEAEPVEATPAVDVSTGPEIESVDPSALIETDNMSVSGYQELMQGPLRTYLDLSQQIGGDVATHANLVNAAFQAQLRYLQLATTRSKPSQAEEVQLLAPTSEHISAIQQFREKNRASKLFNHLSAISESIPALGWVAVSPAPAPYVKEMNDAGQFYTNRVLKEWKEKDKRHAEWCRAWVQLLADLQAFVKRHHTTGLVWSGVGGGAAVPPPPPGGMPPPPPALPDVDFANMTLDDRSALFAEINQGENITSSLRKVTSDMQTHKNPQLRQGPAPFKATAAPSKPLPTPGAGLFDKPPVFTRDGKKWLIEYQKGNSSLVVENADMNNVVYMFRCRESALTVRGKVNAVVLDSCTKCAVVFDNLVSGVDFINCQSVQMQVLGKVPTITIDKTDGCQIYLSPESLDVEIVSSKSSEMNVLLPKPNGDYTELPVPEQYKTLVDKPPTGLTTTPVENKG